MARGMLGASNVEVDVAPVFIGLPAYEGFIVVGVHIAQIVGRASGEARHGAELYGVSLRGLPVFSASEWRLAVGRREIAAHLGQEQGERRLIHEVGYAVLVVYGEGFSPIALAGEDGVAQTVVDLHASDSLLGDMLLGLRDGLLHGESVEVEVWTA